MESIKKFFTFQNIFFLVSFVASLAIAIVFSSLMTWMIFLSSIFGILSSIFATKGKWLTYVFDILSYAVYIYICLVNKFYGELILSVVIIVIHVFALIEWKKNTEEDFVTINNLKAKEIVISISISLVATAIYATILFFIKSEYPIMNACLTVVYLLGNYFAYRRSQLQFLGWILYDILFIVIWGLTAIGGDYGSIIFLIGGASELVYGAIGIFSWTKIEKQQQNLSVKTAQVLSKPNPIFDINKKQSKMSTVAKKNGLNNDKKNQA